MESFRVCRCLAKKAYNPVNSGDTRQRYARNAASVLRIRSLGSAILVYPPRARHGS
jgi:hypothetical protein